MSVNPLEVVVNGVESQQVSVLDRGLQFGDGLFETLVMIDGRIVNASLHYQRLRVGASRLGMQLPPDLEIRFEDWAKQSSHEGNFILKWILTRGCSSRGYAPVSEIAPTEIYERFPFQGFDFMRWQQGVKVSLSHTAITQNSALAGIKHLNRLDSVLAKLHCPEGVDDVLMATESGQIVEASMGNLFWFEGDRCYTPPIDTAGIRGVVRQRLLEDLTVSLGIEVCESSLTLSRLEKADAAFITNAVIGVWPIQLLGSKMQTDHCLVRKIQCWLATWYGIE